MTSSARSGAMSSNSICGLNLEGCDQEKDSRGYGRGPCQNWAAPHMSRFLFLGRSHPRPPCDPSVPVDDLTSRFRVACVTHQLTERRRRHIIHMQ